MLKRNLSAIEMYDITIENADDYESQYNPRTHLKARSGFPDDLRTLAPRGVCAPVKIPPLQKRSITTWLREMLNLKIDHPKNPRIVPLGFAPDEWNGNGFSTNAVNNRHYSLITFLPLSLLNQFKNFFNVFYIFLAFSQCFSPLRVGFLFTYFSPLVLVVLLSLMKDALNELRYFRRDRVANMEKYSVLQRTGEEIVVKACNIKVGDLLVLHCNQRIPADCVLLQTLERGGTTFVRTDQLDGETDWKLRFPLSSTQNLSRWELCRFRANICCEPLHKDIYKFVGTLNVSSNQCEAISLENTLWASCVVASGTLVAAVIHTGSDTRSAMNSAKPRTKCGLIESEFNRIGFLCFFLLTVFSFFLVAYQHFQGGWVIMFVRFFILMSAMIPISMRVNVDVGRLWYSREIACDTCMPGAVCRNTDIPEELGRLQYLFCDKTGTLTKNKMHFRVLQVGPDMTLTDRETDRFASSIYEYFNLLNIPPAPSAGIHSGDNSLRNMRCTLSPQTKPRGTLPTRARSSPLIKFPPHRQRERYAVGAMIKAMVLTHNVNPILDERGGVSFQASSPDEVALVRFCHLNGVTLTERDAASATFTLPSGTPLRYEIVKLFPFNSERKCMGVIVREQQDSTPSGSALELESCSYTYYMKGADVKMLSVVRATGWLEECCQELARVGLRTLVFAQRQLKEKQLSLFMDQYNAANTQIGEGRKEAIAEAMRLLETDMTLLGVTGVEDELQDDVVMSLETFGMCGMKVWVLTGDKVETAATIGRSTRLIPRHGVEEYMQCRSLGEAHARLNQLRRQYDPTVIGDYAKPPWTLILDGGCLSLCLQETLAEFFVLVARLAHSVIVARCSPTQKAVVVQTMRHYTDRYIRMAAIGDGGNDVAMILAADVGIGIEGMEGRQASMAADFSITKFAHSLRLILWHGRNTYRRTCCLSQFIMHRGLVYAIVQAVFSALFAGTTMSLFNGYLLMGYSTIFTMAPAFALVLDEDVRESDINEYPQLYKELLKSRSMNTRTFLEWVWVSIFQGCVMLYVSLQLFSDEMFQIVTITYTSLLITELVIVGSTAHLGTLWRQRRHHFWLYMASEVVSLGAFFLAVIILPDTFDRHFFFSWNCWWRVSVICIASIGPLWVFSMLGQYVLFKKNWSNFSYGYL